MEKDPGYLCCVGNTSFSIFHYFILWKRRNKGKVVFRMFYCLLVDELRRIINFYCYYRWCFIFDLLVSIYLLIRGFSLVDSFNFCSWLFFVERSFALIIGVWSLCHIYRWTGAICLFIIFHLFEYFFFQILFTFATLLLICPLLRWCPQAINWDTKGVNCKSLHWSLWYTRLFLLELSNP